ncbi:hypothetical protein AABM16_00670 [Moraxella catarrhalis]
MQINKAFGIKSAYGQLILLVFLPIVVLAFLGSYLVMSEVRRAILSEQDTMANAALVRYDAIVRPLLTDLQHRQNRLDERVAQMNEDEILIAITPHDTNLPNRAMARHAQDIPFFNTNWFVQLQQSRNQHVLRVAIMDGIGQVLFSTGMQTDLSWGMLIYKPKKSIAYQPL